MKNIDQKEIWKKYEYYPVNITVDEIGAFYLEHNKHMDSMEFYQRIVDHEDKDNEFYTEVFQFYMRHKYGDCMYVSMHDAFEIVNSVKKYRSEPKKKDKENRIANIINEFNIDLSHLFGMTHEDLHIVLIPFEDDTETAFIFGEMMEKTKYVNFWYKGELLGHN